jgi:hypothetical protein
VSRGQYDARLYTDDKVKLARALERDVSHTLALIKYDPSPSPARGKECEIATAPSESAILSMAVAQS